MSILWEKSGAWRWLVRRTMESKPFFIGFATVCGIVPGIIGFCVMSATNTRSPELEAKLRQNARPKTLVYLRGIHIESAIPFIARLPSLEYLCLWNSIYFQSHEWRLGDITFHKLKFLKLKWLGISRWDASEDSFPMLEALVINKCDELEQIPLSFADIPTMKQI